MPSDPEASHGSWLSILLATMLGIACFVALAFITQGIVLGIMLIGGGVFALVAMHYLVWGWWLSKAIQREAEEEGLNE